jgi:outer membrane beta-barrel protein
MANGIGIRVVIAGITISCVIAQATAQEDQENRSQSRVRIIEPDKTITEAQPAAIDTEKFQLGFYLGTLSVEDFGTDVVTGLELTYHISSDWFVQGNYGVATIDKAAFETNQQFLASDDRDFEYFAITGGYRWIQGRSFLGSRSKYNSDIYLLAGAEQVSFAANDETGLNLGLSYRLVLTDWTTLNVDFREHMFKRDFIGDSKQTFNTEFRVGLNALF